MKALLEGKPVKHPLHTWLVHFPIGFWMLSFVLDCYTRFKEPSSAVVSAAYYAVAMGTLMALVAAAFGLADYTSIRRDHAAKRIATWHMVINVLAVLLYLVNTYSRAEHTDAMRVPWPNFFMSLVGVGMISLSGYLGGMIVYDQGIAVGRHRQNVCTPDRTVHINSEEAANQRGREGETSYYFVAPVNRLQEEQFLRVSIGGFVILIVKIGHEYHAVQDFCTHRSAPLSEGCVHGGEIQCPWHNSRFDLKSGKVTQGPAKVDLKTFAVRELDGEVHVGIERG